MRAASSLSIKLMRTGTALLLVGLASIGLTLWVTWQLEGGAAAVNEAGRMRMQTWRLSSSVQAGIAPEAVQELVSSFDRSLELLLVGDATRPLFVPWDESSTAKFAEVQRLWSEQRVQWLQPKSASPETAMRSADAFVVAIDAFVFSIEQQISRFTAILNLFQFLMMALAVGSAAVMLYVGYQYVINPLNNLREGLRRLESGDFDARVGVATQDEFGQVALGFNGMARRLQELYGSLEAQVVAKTQHIESQRARIEILYDISAFLARADSIEELSKGFAERVRKAMKADAVAIRWSDEANQRYLMLASDCFPKEMLEEERSLLSGACACGNLQPDARTRVIPIHSHDAAPMRLCARAGFEILVSVPIRVQHRLIGEIDLFFRSDVRLKQEEVELLDALASHLASSLEGLRAAALEREAAAGQERTLLARELHDSIAQSLAFLKIQAQLLRAAMQKGQPDRVDAALNELDQGLRESVSDVRELLMHFRTRTNTDDIETALQETLQKFRTQAGLDAQFKIDGAGLPLPPDVQVQVLHIVQEALSNVRKHAGATRVSLEVHRGAKWRIVVRDDGAGFDARAPVGETHVGLKIMHERAARIGADVEVESEKGEGSLVTLTLPPYPTVVEQA